MDEKEFYTVTEVVEILRLSRDRVYEYLRAGYIRGSRVAPRGGWRIHRIELERIMGTGLKPRDQAQLESTIAPVLTDEDLREHRAPAVRLIYYDPQTDKGHAFVFEEGIEKQIPVVFDPYRLVWKPRTD
jgi:excisionase family DNA binding protein